jgi:Prophage tail length tape measure protein.
MSNQLGDMVVAITGDTSNFNLSIDAAGKKFDSLTTIIAKSSADMATSFKKIDNEAKLWGESTDLIKQKQQALKDEMTSLMKQGFDPLSPKVQSLKTQYSALENEAKALGKEHVTLKSSMQEIDGMMGGFGAKIGALLTNPYILAATAVIAVIKTFSDFTKELVEYGAHIQETSEKTGMSTKSLQEYKFIAEQTGGSLETITTSIKMMTRGLDTNADTFKKLGIETKDINGNFLSTTDIFNQTIGKLGDLTNDTERTKLALKLFGRGALDMVPLLKEGSAGIEELRQKANDLGLVLNENTIKNAHDFEKSTDALKASWKAFSMSLVQDALPALKLVTDSYLYVTELINRARVAAENNGIIKAFKDGKASIIEYHDAVQSMIDMNKEVVNDDKSSAKQKKIANQEIADGYAMLTKVRKEYREASEAQIKIDNQIAKDNAVAKALQDEAALQEEINSARDKAGNDYLVALAKIKQEIISGGSTDKEISDNKIKAVKDYVSAIEDIIVKYNLTEGKTVELAKKESDNLKQLTQAENAYADDKASSDKAKLDRATSYSEAVKKQISDEIKANKDATDKYNKEVENRTKINEGSEKAYDKLLNGNFKSFDDIEKAKTEAEKSGIISRSDIEKAASEATIKLYSNTFNSIASQASSWLSQLSSIYSQDATNQKDAIAQKLQYAEAAIDKETEAKEKAAGVATKTALETAQTELQIATDTYNGKLRLIDAETQVLDDEEEALLYSLGLKEASTLEEYDKEIAAAIAAGDTTTAAKLQAERDKLAIQQEYDKKRKAITDAEALRVATDADTKAKIEQDAADQKTALEKKAALDTYAIQKKQFETNKALSITQAIIDTASAVMQAMKSLPWPWDLIPMGIVAGLGAAQVATIANQQPPAPPALAEGGIVMPSNGGSLVNVAEAGQPEAIFPLDKLEQFINQGNTFSGSSDIPINMTITLDSNTLYSGIFAATRNKTVLISAKALV